MDAKLKLLGMIQDVIKRMANNSFLLKGWTVTLVAAMIALSEKADSEGIVLVYYIPIIMFWTLDSYYLQVERKFRVLYRSMAEASPDELDFSMAMPKSNNSDKTEYCQSLFSKTEMAFYIPLAVLTAAATLLFF